jgi:hypothetical protein
VPATAWDPSPQVAGHCEKVSALQDRRAGLYHALEEALLRLKANKEVSAFQNTLKRIGGGDITAVSYFILQQPR